VQAAAAFTPQFLRLMFEITADALAEQQGGCVYFDASSFPAQFISFSTKFYQAAASSGAAVAIIGKHAADLPNIFSACEFSGLAASVDGGSFLLVNTTASINLCGFSNNFAVSGASRARAQTHTHAHTHTHTHTRTHTHAITHTHTHTHTNTHTHTH